MTISTIYLKKEINQGYYNIAEEYNALMDIWIELNNRIHTLKIPKLFIRKVKPELVKIKEDGEKLNNKYIKWNKKATDFLLNPKFYYERTQVDRELVYINFTNSLRFIINKMENNIVLIASNYNNRSSQYRGQRNFIIAIIAFIIGFAGLSITLYSTFFTTKVDTAIINKIIPLKIEKIDEELNIIGGQIDSLISSNIELIKNIEPLQLLDTITEDCSINKTLIEKGY